MLFLYQSIALIENSHCICLYSLLSKHISEISKILHTAYRWFLTYLYIVNGFIESGIWESVTKKSNARKLTKTDFTNIDVYKSREEPYTSYLDLYNDLLSSRNLLVSDGPLYYQGFSDTKTGALLTSDGYLAAFRDRDELQMEQRKERGNRDRKTASRKEVCAQELEQQNLSRIEKQQQAQERNIESETGSGT